MALAVPVVRIGCAGWSIGYAKDVLGTGDGSQLERYARVFDAVEINSSFYRPHLPKTYARWAASVPARFRFSVKMPREITHARRLRDCAEPLQRFLAATMGKTRLHVMQDPLARTNVMAYRAGEALNWHFDRSEFTTTLLLQASERGGDLEYRTDLRSDDNPNYDGVARLLEGRDPEAKILRMKPGTLNVFRGKNTAHRVTTVEGNRERMIAVFSYYEKPGVMFSDEERIGFYGRAA